MTSPTDSCAWSDVAETPTLLEEVTGLLNPPKDAEEEASVTEESHSDVESSSFDVVSTPNMRTPSEHTVINPTPEDRWEMISRRSSEPLLTGWDVTTSVRMADRQALVVATPNPLRKALLAKLHARREWLVMMQHAGGSGRLFPQRHDDPGALWGTEHQRRMMMMAVGLSTNAALAGPMRRDHQRHLFAPHGHRMQGAMAPRTTAPRLRSAAAAVQATSRSLTHRQAALLARKQQRKVRTQTRKQDRLQRAQTAAAPAANPKSAALLMAMRKTVTSQARERKRDAKRARA